jgi:hypothetical protein
MEMALLVSSSATMTPPKERQRQQDGDRLEHRVEQQHQHAEHHQQAGAHGGDEALEHLMHDLGIAAGCKETPAGRLRAATSSKKLLARRRPRPGRAPDRCRC